MSLQAVNVVPNVILAFSVPSPFITLSLSLSLPVSLPLPLPNKRISTGLTTGYITFIFELPGNFTVSQESTAFLMSRSWNLYIMHLNITIHIPRNASFLNPIMNIYFKLQLFKVEHFVLRHSV